MTLKAWKWELCPEYKWRGSGVGRCQLSGHLCHLEGSGAECETVEEYLKEEQENKKGEESKMENRKPQATKEVAQTRNIEIDVERKEGKVKILAIRNILPPRDIPTKYLMSHEIVCARVDDGIRVWTPPNRGEIWYNIKAGDIVDEKRFDTIIVPDLRKCGENLMKVKAELRKPKVETITI